MCNLFNVVNAAVPAIFPTLLSEGSLSEGSYNLAHDMFIHHTHQFYSSNSVLLYFAGSLQTINLFHLQAIIDTKPSRRPIVLQFDKTARVTHKTICILQEALSH